MNLVVTGASGFIGRALVASLAEHGHVGVAIGRNAVRSVPPKWSAQTRADALQSKANHCCVDAVVHPEVKHHVPCPRSADLEDFTAVNVKGTQAWLDWAESHDVDTFVFTSSVKAVHRAAGVCDENAEMETSDAYGRSKAAAEQAVRASAGGRPSRSAVVLRYSPVYGPGNAANLASFAKQVIGGKPCLIGPGSARKSLLSRRNAIAAIEYALARKEAGCSVFNVSDGAPVSLRELAFLIADAAGAPAPRKVPRVLGACVASIGDMFELITGREWLLDSRKLKTLTTDSVFPPNKLLSEGFVPPQITEDGIREMVHWLLTQAALGKS